MQINFVLSYWIAHLFFDFCFLPFRLIYFVLFDSIQLIQSSCLSVFDTPLFCWSKLVSSFEVFVFRIFFNFLFWNRQKMWTNSLLLSSRKSEQNKMYEKWAQEINSLVNNRSLHWITIYDIIANFPSFTNHMK